MYPVCRVVFVWAPPAPPMRQTVPVTLQTMSSASRIE